jgi:mRNA interferase RelE/StbE
MGTGEERAWLSLIRFEIELTSKARKSIKGLQPRDQIRIATALELLRDNPLPPKALKLRGRDGYRIRLGKLRIIYTITRGKLTILVIDVDYRREMYR